MRISNNTKGLMMVMSSAVMFGLMPMFAKLSYAEGVNVISLLFYRYFLAFIMLAIFVKGRRKNLSVTKKQFAPLFIASLVGTVFTTYSLFLSYDYISTGLASTLHFIYPAITCILAYFVYKEHFGRNKFFALLISMIGIAMLSLNGNIDISIKGMFWALISGVFYAIYIICAANKELKKLSPYVVAFYIFLMSCLIFLVWGLITNEIMLNIHPVAIIYIGSLSFWATFVAVILFFVGMKEIGPSKAAVLSTFEPMTGVLIGLALFHEPMSIKMLIGCALILFSVVIISRDKIKHKKTSVIKS